MPPTITIGMPDEPSPRCCEVSLVNCEQFVVVANILTIVQIGVLIKAVHVVLGCEGPKVNRGITVMVVVVDHMLNARLDRVAAHNQRISSNVVSWSLYPIYVLLGCDCASWKSCACRQISWAKMKVGIHNGSMKPTMVAVLNVMMGVHLLSFANTKFPAEINHIAMGQVLVGMFAEDAFHEPFNLSVVRIYGTKVVKERNL